MMPCRFASPLLAICIVGVAAAARGAAAQDRPPTPAPDSAQAEASCVDGRITYIFIDNHSIFDVEDLPDDERLSWLYDVANALHARTRRDVIARELLFETGDCYDALLLEDSERLLRDLGILARVDVYGVRQQDGGHHVIVDTRDEWSTQLDVLARWSDGPVLEGAALRETNLLGTGRSIGLFYYDRRATREYGIAFGTPQLGGTRWDLHAAVGRTRPGTFVRTVLAHPFVGEVGRWAARQSFERRDRFFDFAIDDDAGERHALLPVLDAAFDIAAVRRLGDPGRLTLLGGAVAVRQTSYPDGADGIRLVTGRDYDAREDAPAAVAEPVRAQMNGRQSLRAYAIIGRRNIGWVKRRGLDSMRGEQDIRLGLESTLAVGRSLPPLRDDDVHAMLTLYAAAEQGPALFATRLRTDLRHDFRAPPGERGLRDVFADVEAFAYGRDALPRQTLVLRLAAAGGWNVHVPFQLTLGGDDALRGYGPERLPGARRALLTIEDRIFFGWPFPDVLDLGGTAFVDVGRIWPDGAPFGVDSGWRTTAGIGLRGAFPAGSRTTYRMDLAWPVDQPFTLGNMRLMITVGELRGLTREFDTLQLRRSRPRGVSGRSFYGPR